jgi:CRISPR-associated protein Csm5
LIKRYKVRLHTLSPVHIGAGEFYDPTQFIIDSENKMYVFDKNSFIANLSEQKLAELSKLSLDSRNPIPVIRFFRDNFDKNRVKHRVLRASNDLKDGYENLCKTSSLRAEVFNQFELKRTIYNPMDAQPYIPGSSLKGAIKTFVMSVINANEEGEQKSNFRDTRDMENTVLGGSFSKDPFRFVKISDLRPVVEENASESLTEIVYAVMVPKNIKKEERGELTVALEVIKTGGIFEGIISLDNQGDLPEKTARWSVNMNKILGCSSKYYASKIKSENELLAKLQASGLRIDEKFLPLFKTSFLVRLGHHSSAEFMTIDGHKNIKISPPGVKPRFEKSATTIWLASKLKKPDSRRGMHPFGWALVEFEELKD